MLIALTDKVKADVPLIVRRPPIISDNSTRCALLRVANDELMLNQLKDSDADDEVFAISGQWLLLRVAVLS